ncbi:MAG: ABC transporter ATP-binding protein [Acidobacteria bacterium]|nr:ABC transporter ATP-binding protein [Acidobacteriota bacterium]
MKEIKTVQLLRPFLRMYPWGLPAMVVLGTLSSLAEGIGISLFVPLLESLDPQRRPSPAVGWFQGVPAGHRLFAIVASILALTICKGLLAYSDSVLAASINSRITHAIRSRTFAKMIGMSQSALDRMQPGRLLNLLGTDTWHTSDAISLFVNLVINLCSIAVFFALLVALSWRLTLLVVLGVALVSLLLRTVSAGARGLGRQGVEANAAMSEQMLDGLEGIQVIQMFGLQAHRQKLFDTVSEKLRSIYFRLDLLHRAVHPLSEILYIGLLLGILLAGVSLRNSVPTVVVFLLLLYRLQPQIRQLDSARLSLTSLAPSVEDVMRFLAADPGPFPAASRFAGFNREIRFNGVTFFYESGDGFSLDNLSFHVPHGKTTAIVGPSGSGKTTIVSLLCRFRDPVLGEIHVDGVPLAGIDVVSWRSQIAWAGQDTYLFSATVRENIRYGNLAASDEEVARAAVEADADHFIRSLPEGYGTKIGPGGLALSGGQTQRLALARALLRKPAILILDEATSALDSVSEDTIQRYLQRRKGNPTVVVISHRLSTMRYADHVVVLHEGRISEQGSPKELFARRGFLFRLRELQNAG